MRTLAFASLLFVVACDDAPLDDTAYADEFGESIADDIDWDEVDEALYNSANWTSDCTVTLCNGMKEPGQMACAFGACWCVGSMTGTTAKCTEAGCRECGTTSAATQLAGW